MSISSMIGKPFLVPILFALLTVMPFAQAAPNISLYKPLDVLASNWTTDASLYTNDRVASTTYGSASDIFQSVRGLDNLIYTRCLCGVSITNNHVNYQISPWFSDPSGTTPSAIALVSFNDNLYQAVRGFDNRVYSRSSTDGVDWTSWLADPVSYTEDAVTLAVHNGKLYEAAHGTGNKIYTRSSSDGQIWSDWNENGGGTPSTIAMSSFAGLLFQSVRGLDNRIYTRSAVDGVNWSSWDRDELSFTQSAISTASGVGTLNNAQVNVFVQEARGTGNRIYVRMKVENGSWNAWSTVEDIAHNNGYNVFSMTTSIAPTITVFRPEGSDVDAFITTIKGEDNNIYWI